MLDGAVYHNKDIYEAEPCIRSEEAMTATASCGDNKP